MSVQLQDTASGKVLDYPTDGPGLRIERGGYRVLSRRASDIAPAAAQEIEVDARSTKAVVLADPGESLASRYQRAKLDYDFARRSAERSIKTRRSLRTIGWTMLGIGAGSGGLAAYSYFDGLEKYEQYVNNPFSSSMDDYRERAQDASRLFSAALSIGIGSLVSGVILQVVAPNPARVQGEAEDRRRILEGLADEYRALPAYLKASEMLE